jgi:hypothetical protein
MVPAEGAEFSQKAQNIYGSRFQRIFAFSAGKKREIIAVESAVFIKTFLSVPGLIFIF